MTTGVSFLLRETEAVYQARAAEHLTSHQLADFRRCPLLYWQKKQGSVTEEERPAYLIGRAAHVLILEGQEAFDAQFARGGPINPRTGRPYGTYTQAWAEWAAAQGKPVITEEQFALAARLAASVRAHAVAVELFAEGVPEGVVRVEYCGRPCQARLDFFNPQHGIIDLKTCDDLTWFEADARRFGYVHQFAFYHALVRCATGQEVIVHTVAVEKKPPYRCGVWRLAEQALAVARGENEAALARLMACEQHNYWPTGYEEIRVFDYI